MDAGIHIGNTRLDDYAAAVAEAITEVAKCHDDREVVLRALEVLRDSTSIQGVAITGATVSSVNYNLRPEVDR